MNDTTASVKINHFHVILVLQSAADLASRSRIVHNTIKAFHHHGHRFHYNKLHVRLVRVQAVSWLAMSSACVLCFGPEAGPITNHLCATCDSRSPGHALDPDWLPLNIEFYPN